MTFESMYTRRTGGIYYTHAENIRKVIDPLFLDDLRAELDSCKNRRQLLELQSKIGGLKFFDPACGSGNFLVETYLSLRRLENDILKKIVGDIDNPIRVTLDNFYGLEIDDSACAVARTAMWIAESQMMIETVEIIHRELDFLPLKTSAHITRADALAVDWRDIVPRGVDYIIGNPPFVGASMMNAQQKAAAVAVFGKGKLVNSIDYVGAWYHKAAALMVGTPTRAAFVSTNSIAQGEQVGALWRRLLGEYKVHIDFAYRPFKWTNEMKDNAAVHCVVIGFSHAPNDKPRIIFDGDKKVVAKNINPYLVDAPDILIESRTKPLSDVPRMTKGNQPTDGGHLILSEAERDRLLKDDPKLECCIRRYVGAKDFINSGEARYCLWLRGIDPSVYQRSREIMRRLEAVREMRSKSTSKPTRDMAERSHLFFSAPQLDGKNLILIPRVSSSRRKYIPMDFAEPTIIAADSLEIIQGATPFHFGVLMSRVHMAWMRRVCGRLGMGYRYSAAVVYNNFVWCARTSSIERTARAILDARKLYPHSTLADLYDPNVMPEELRAAHEANDWAVADAYGFARALSEEEIVGRLMEMYQRLTAGATTDKISN